MSSPIILSDKIHLTKDTIDVNNRHHHPTLWAKTQIIGGYGLHKNKNGISELDEVVFETENMVPIGGVQFAMEMLYGVTGPINVPTLNDKYQIGAQGSEVVPSQGMPYAYGQKVCLFGVGCNGAVENNLTAKAVKYNEWELSEMVPFRFTNDDLSESESLKYFGKKRVNVGESNLDGSIMAYYMKKFDEDPKIYHLYKDGEEGEDGSEVDTSVYDNHENEIGIESFTESLLTITKKDVREWFDYNGNIELSRINSIALFTAVWDEKQKDYANIKMFSKLNIPTEPLSLTKDMKIIYRVYGA